MSRSWITAAGLALVACLGAGCQKNLPITSNDRDVVLRAADLIPFGYGLEKTEHYETFSRIRYFDGSHELTYEYKTPDGEEENVLFMNVTVSVEKTDADAWTTYGAQGVGINVGLKANGVEQRELKDFYKYGDSSTYYMLEKNGQPIGNIFTARDGKRVLVVVMSGMYFDDAATWKQLIEGKLRKFSAYTPN